MKTWLKRSLVLISALSLTGSTLKATTPQRGMSLYYGRPAAVWMTEALPIGNGELGAMFMGGVLRERIQFNEKTLWTGSPEIRGAYQSFGDLMIYMHHGEDYVNYERDLSIDNALGRVQYETSDGTRYTREYLSSHPDGVIAVRISAKRQGVPHKVNLALALYDSRPQVAERKRNLDKSTLSFSGKLETLHYQAKARVHAPGATLSTERGRLRVQDADEVIIYLVAGTNYDIHSPSYTTGLLGEINQKQDAILDKAVSKGYERIKADHIKDYRNLYDRVKLCLASDTQSPDNLPSLEDIYTDDLVRSRRSSVYLDELYFQYGRYLMIASSRGMDLPNNLQGIWNDDNTPPWECDIHTNINIQMNYWPAETTNLSECHKPFLNYIAIESARPNGGMRKTAEREGLRGWSLHTQSTIFSHTDWNINRPTNAWYSMHLWQHYLYTLDKDYLERVALPAMRSATEYWFDRLVLDSRGMYIAPKEWSPEHGPWEDGIAYAQQLIAELFDAMLSASKVVKMDKKFLAELQEKSRKLDRGLTIGSWGQLREWKVQEDQKGNEHRHLSHLIALFPGNQISYNKDKAMADAAKVSLTSRGDIGTGWSRAWKISCWARLGDGDHAYRLLKSALNHSDHTDLSMDSFDGGVYSNLLDAHPPFQIDGNFGATAGIAEMLLQSHEGFINPLPALPKAWASGSISGLKAVGNYEVDLRWRDMRLTSLKLKSHKGGTVRLKLDASKVASIKSLGAKPTTKVYKIDKQGILHFPTNSGESYLITMQ